jgi:pyrroline-5-carboxylate reductase
MSSSIQMSRNNAHVCPVVRVMPNTAASVGESATAIARSENCSDGQSQLVKTMMATVGMCHIVPEKLMDAVCGLSGSGPAYVMSSTPSVDTEH